ncbi:MAG: cell division protein SepF [Tissierellales bacterium]|nr:cell division protein SepF [Tissierellales bacterium]MBN2827677.1 cell division protein SepF [Tissierellales bacterium]
MFKKLKDIIGLTDLEEEYEDEPETEEKKDDSKRSENAGYSKNKASKNRENEKVIDNADLFILSPRRYEDCAGVIDELKRKKTIVLNLEELELDLKKQIFEFVKGGVYALEANIQKVSADIFVIAPYNVEISGKLKYNSDKKRFTWE